MSRAAPADRPVGARAGFVRSARAGLPTGIAVFERPPLGALGDRPVTVLVHGALDRSASFGRVARRLPELAVVAFDRSGYAGSREAGPATSLRDHVEDLLAIAAVFADGPGTGDVCAVGHSLGGTVVFGAAVARPALFASVGAYEASMPWLGFRRRERSGSPTERDPHGGDPGDEAERFFRRMMGDGAWERLNDEQRAERRADGPALRADLRALAEGAPFDVTGLRVPAVAAVGGPQSAPHHHMTVDWLVEHVPSVRRADVAEAAHGAHLSHPDAFAALVRGVVALAPNERTGPP